MAGLFFWETGVGRKAVHGSLSWRSTGGRPGALQQFEAVFQVGGQAQW